MDRWYSRIAAGYDIKFIQFTYMKNFLSMTRMMRLFIYRDTRLENDNL